MEILKPSFSSLQNPVFVQYLTQKEPLSITSHHYHSSYHHHSNKSVSLCDLAITCIVWIFVIFTEFLSSDSIQKVLKQWFDWQSGLLHCEIKGILNFFYCQGIYSMFCCLCGWFVFICILSTAKIFLMWTTMIVLMDIINFLFSA